MSTAVVVGNGADIVAELVGVEAAVPEAVGIEGAGEGARVLLSAFSIGRLVASPERFVLCVFFLPGGVASNPA